VVEGRCWWKKEGVRERVEEGNKSRRAALSFEVAAGQQDRRKLTKDVIVLLMMKSCGEVKMLLVEVESCAGKG